MAIKPRKKGMPLTRKELRWLAPASLVLIYILALVRTAWLNDDAYITFRTIDNLYQGYGLTWNISERVQAYTHPLWLGAVATGYALTGKLLASAIGLSMLTSIGAVALLTARIARSAWIASICLLILLLSRSFVDYSSSGLENPLSHLLVVAFAAIQLRGLESRRKLLALFGIACLAALSRLDSLIIYIPALVVLLRRGYERSDVIAALTGFIPLVLWEGFSVIYYGLPFPNTAYAKLNIGIPTLELVSRGFRYVFHSVLNDPITPVGILAGIVAATRSRRTNEIALAAGILLYLGYVVWIGGDFMAGRFFSLPLLVAVCILARQDAREPGVKLGAVVLLLVVGLGTPYPTILSGRDYGQGRGDLIDQWGISDERAVYYPYTGLLQTGGKYEVPYHPWMEAGIELRHGSNRVVTGRTVGFLGYFAGPEIHIIDQFALADSLLARLPTNIDPEWRPGHFDRRIPEGYQESLQDRSNLIRSSSLSMFYDRLRTVIEEPLWQSSRWKAILLLNLGRYDHLIDEHVRSQYQQLRLVLIDVKERAADGEGRARGPMGSGRGAWIDLEAAVHSRSLGVELQSGREYVLILLKRGRPIYRVFTLPSSGQGLSLESLRLPPWTVLIGYDGLLVIPLDDLPFAMGTVELDRATGIIMTLE